MSDSVAGGVPARHSAEQTSDIAPAQDAPVTTRARVIGIVSLVLFAVVSFALVVWATRWGAGLSLDSTRYLFAANNLTAALTGDATHRLTHYPPLFPVVLSVSRLFGTAPVAWARWLNAALLALNTILAGWVLLRVMNSTRTVFIAVFTVALLALYRGAIGAYASVWSEPLYITFLLLALLAMNQYLIDDAYPRRTLILAAAMVSAALLTRYAGAALIPSGVIAILWLNRSRRRWAHAAMFVGVSAAIPLLLGMYNRFTAGTATDRAFEYHRPTRFHILGLQQTLIEWFVPRGAPAFLGRCIAFSAAAIGLMILLAIFRGIFFRRAHDSEPPASTNGLDQPSLKLAGLLLVFTLCYPVFVIFSISFLDIRTPLDARILLPTFVTGLMLVALVVRWIWLTPARLMEARIAITLLGVILVAGYGNSAISFARASADNGLGWSRKKFNDPLLGALLETIPDNVILYTNLAQPVIADRFAGTVERLPMHNGDPKKDPGFRLEMRTLRQQVEDGDAWILFFSHKPKPSELSHAELRQALILQIRGRGEGWILYSRNRRRMQEAAAAARAARNAGKPPASTSAPAEDADDVVPDLDQDLPDGTP